MHPNRPRYALTQAHHSIHHERIRQIAARLSAPGRSYQGMDSKTGHFGATRLDMHETVYIRPDRAWLGCGNTRVTYKGSSDAPGANRASVNKFDGTSFLNNTEHTLRPETR